MESRKVMAKEEIKKLLKIQKNNWMQDHDNFAKSVQRRSSIFQKENTRSNLI